MKRELSPLHRISPTSPNFLTSSIEVGTDTFTFKEAASQPDRLYFVKETIKKIGAHEIEKHWTLVGRRELNGK